MSEPLDTTPCRRPSASSTNGTLASLRGRAGGITRTVLDSSQSANGTSPSPRWAEATERRGAAELTRDHRQARRQRAQDRRGELWRHSRSNIVIVNPAAPLAPGRGPEAGGQRAAGSMRLSG